MPFHRLLSAIRKSQKSLPALEADAIEAIREGNAVEEQGKHKDALKCYEKATELAPNLPRAHLNRGNSLLELADIEGALAAYDKALTLDPKYAAAHFNRGNACFRSGQHTVALQAYEQAIRLKPDFADAFVAMGVLNEATGHLDRSLENYRQALAINPEYAEVHVNLGDLLRHNGQRLEAINSFNRAIELKPGYITSYIALGNTLSELGKHQEVVSTLRKVLHIEPDNFLASNGLGNALLEMGYIDEAIASYRHCLKITPESVEAQNNLANALCRKGNVDDAIAIYYQAIKINSDYAPAHVNLGNALKGIGDFRGAISCYRTALAINPRLVEAHVNLGNALKDVGQFTLAVESYERALSIKPELAEAHNNLGVAFKDSGMLNRAVECYRHAIKLQPEFVEAHCNLGVALIEVGDIDGALASLKRGIELKPDYADAYSLLLFLQHYYSLGSSDVSLLDSARRFGELVSKQAGPRKMLDNRPEPDRNLRIGFVSGDFSNHPVGYFLEGVLSALHSKAVRRLEIFAYSTCFKVDAVTDSIRMHCDAWNVVAGLSDKKFVEKIRRDRIDILIDLSGHTTHNRLSAFAWKPAPVQITWLGYFATTGVEPIDYLIADPWTLPQSEEANFVEKIWRLPDTRLCFTPPASNTEVSELPARHNGYVTFGCFNHLSKINDDVVRCWARILTAVPKSRLFLKARQLGDPTVLERTEQRFVELGVPSARMILEGPSSREVYLARYHEVDIALDPFPYTGGTTTAEALWMGVPVLTMTGRSLLERQGVGLLANAGLPEWIAEDRDDYIARAVSYSENTQGLALLRKGLRQKVLASPIFDAQLFANNFEVALRDMWRKWCGGHQDQSADGGRPASSSLTV